MSIEARRKDIERFRGDTSPLYLTLTKNNAPLNLAGCSAKMTVHKRSDPKETDFEFQKTASVASESGGKFKFDFLEADVDLIGDFNYDMELTDAEGKKTTVKFGKLKFFQDITK